MADTIALIGSGIMAKHLAFHARKIGVETICFSFDPNDVAVGAVDRFYNINIFDTEKILNVCRQEKIQGVLPTTELTIPTAAFLAEAMGLNGNPLEVMTNITSKRWVRDRLKDAVVIKQPRYACLADHTAAAPELSFPVIVKPAGEGGKRGVAVAHDEREYEACLQAAFAADRSRRGVMVEEYIPAGMECSVEVLSYHGEHQIIQVTRKLCSGAPHCVELGHDQPADVSDETRNRIELAVRELLDRTGFANGPAHVEIKLYGGQVYLIELNARLGGDCIAYPLTVLSTGYDYLSEVVRAAMDLPPKRKDQQTHLRYAGMRYVVRQTAYLKELFDICDGQPWLYEKNKVTDELIEMTHNDMENTNYFIYCTDERPVFPGEEKYLSC